MNLCIGSERKDDFGSPRNDKLEFVFSTDEAIDLPVLADTEFFFIGAILPKSFGCDLEILNDHLTS